MVTEDTVVEAADAMAAAAAAAATTGPSAMTIATLAPGVVGVDDMTTVAVAAVAVDRRSAGRACVRSCWNEGRGAAEMQKHSAAGTALSNSKEAIGGDGSSGSLHKVLNPKQQHFV